jgi:hypothetical protein
MVGALGTDSHAIHRVTERARCCCNSIAYCQFESQSDLVALEDVAKMMYLKNIVRENSGHAQ